MRTITEKTINLFELYLIEGEKASATVYRYLYDIKEFSKWIGNNEICKNQVLEYKTILLEKYAPSSVNVVISSLNAFFSFCEWYDLKMKNIKIQKQIFTSNDKELSKAEYSALLQVAKSKKSERLFLLIQTICSTGIRVSELEHITVQAVCRGHATVNCKGKVRYIFLPKQLCFMLKQYLKKLKIKSGAIFITKNGKPLDRSNIWLEMKKLCKEANVCKKKVFPHNLRHLFAREYYDTYKDIVRLADILGHSSVSTTRIYTMESGEIHNRQIQKLGLLRC